MDFRSRAEFLRIQLQTCSYAQSFVLYLTLAKIGLQSKMLEMPTTKEG